MLKVKIKKELYKFILDIDFEIDEEIIGLIGPSGSGKSMMLKCISGIEKPDSGIIEYDNRVLFDSAKKINLRPQVRKIGYLFQDYALFPQMTVEKNILVSVNKKYSRDDKIDKTNDIIKVLNLDGLQKKYPRELSGGEKQRVAFARLIVNEPDFLLLDEPFSSLDSFLKWNIAKELKNIIKKINKKAIFVSHDINEINYLCEKTIVLADGKMIDSGKVKDIIENSKFSHLQISKNMIK